MRAGRNASLAFVASLLLICAIFGGFVRAQGSAGHLMVSADYQLFGISDLRGGGHVTWTLTGAMAADFRGKILHLFDTYPAIPRGFPSAGTPTDGNRNGVLEAAEGVVYTSLLEARLEATGTGTRAQYLQLYPFDLLESGGSESERFLRSTSGLVGTTEASTEEVVIRFIFSANTTREARVLLATSAFADALYEGFSYRAAQCPTLLPPCPSPESWPFIPGGGWHVVNATGRPAFWGGRGAFWAGNDSSGGYDSNLGTSSVSSMDPVLATLDPSYHAFDFRFASRAWATFNYTGSLGPGDSLTLEYAHPPAYSDWTFLEFNTGVSLPPSNNSWSPASVDLTPVLGERVRLRFHFISDGSGAPSTVYVRDFTVEAPSEYVGEVIESDTHYLIGPLSVSDPHISSGSVQVIRTPGGEVIFYGTTWQGSPPAGDTIVFRTFYILENPQILFGVMLIAAHRISRMQESAYDAYWEAQPALDRPRARPTKWLHRAGKVAIGVLIVFYLVPNALGVVGLRVFVGGFAYVVLALALILGVGFGTRAYYRRREPVPAASIEEGPLVRKVVLPAPAPSGEMDAAEVGRDRRPATVTVRRDRKPVSLRCDSCGEVQAILEGTDPRAATCPSCGGRLRRLDEAKRYLIVARSPAIAFAWMRDLTKSGKPALCFASASPDRLRLEFGIKSLAIVHVSSTAAGALDPAKLDPQGLRSILPLTRQGKSGVILYDGVEEMIADASLGDVIRFLRKANDMAFVHGVTVIARIAPGALTDDEVRRLLAEFDEYLDLSEQM